MRRSALLLALLAPASAALADETPEEATRRLEDRNFFVQRLGRPWRPLLADITKTIEKTPADAAVPMRRVRDDAAARFAPIAAGDGTEAGRDEGYRWYGVLAKDAVDESVRRGVAERGAEIDVTKAREFVEKKKWEDARVALQRCLDLAPLYSPAFELTADVILRRCAELEAEGREDFSTSLQVSEEGLADLPVGSEWASRVDGHRKQILATTGAIVVEWVGDALALSKVPGARTDFRTAKLVLRPADGGPGKSPPPQALDAPRGVRVRNGKYSAVARADGGGEQRGGDVEVGGVETSVQLVPVVPDGMVIVRPADRAAEWMLVDRTEVSNADFRRVIGRSAGSDERAAAAGVTLAEAREYAKRVSKQLPTEAQWKVAAFGTATPATTPEQKKTTFPWNGTAATSGRHFQGGRSSAGPVDGCPEGASPCDALNMAGNVWEWLADGWLLGGGWTFEQLHDDFPEANNSPHEFFFLHDKLPTEEIYQTFSAGERNTYDTYRAGENTLPEAGLRCVIPVGRPRRP